MKSFNAEAQGTQSKTRGGNKFLLLSLRFSAYSAPEALKVSLFIEVSSYLKRLQNPSLEAF